MTLSKAFKTDTPSPRRDKDKVPSMFPSEFPSTGEERVITPDGKEKVPTIPRVEVYPTLIELGLKAEVPASDIAELKKFRLEKKIREEIRDADKLEEMILEKVRIEQEASARERIDDAAKRFENLKFGENQVIEVTGYADTVLNVLRDNYIPEYTMVTLGMILIITMIFKMFKTCFRWKKEPIIKDEKHHGPKLVKSNISKSDSVNDTVRPKKKTKSDPESTEYVLNLWMRQGIDITDTATSKAISRGEQQIGISKFDLSSSKVQAFIRDCEDRSKGLGMTSMLKYEVPTHEPGVEEECNLIVQGRRIPFDMVEARSKSLWNENPEICDDEIAKFHDMRVKSKTFGAALLASLTSIARQTMDTNYSPLYNVEYQGQGMVDGAVLMHCLLKECKPPSETAIQSVKAKIHAQTLVEKSIPKSFTRLQKLFNEAEQLGAEFGEADKRDAVYRIANEVKNDSFRQYITILHREDTRKAGNYEKVRSSTVLIQELKDEWIRINNLPSTSTSDAKDVSTSRPGSAKGKTKSSNVDFSTVVALLTQVIAKNGTTPKKNDPPPEEPWRIENDDKMETKVKDGKEWHWCTKCRQGKGKWQTHKTSAHVNNYFRKTRDSKKESENKEESKKEKKTPNKPPGLIIDKAALTAAKNGDIAGFLANLPGISDDDDDVKD